MNEVMNQKTNLELGQGKVTGTDITLQQVENALAKVEPSFAFFNHSHSQFTWKVQNLSQYSTARNLRQVTAELNRKKQALSEAKFKYLKKQINLKKKLEENEKDELALLEIEEMREQSIFLRNAYEGCMKDVMVLVELHEQLKEKIVIKYGKYDEEVFEIEEKTYWIKRIFSQALWDIRASGRIGAGNQEALEQLNIQSSFALQLCLKYLESETKNENTTADKLRVFLEEVSEEYKNNINELLEYRGLDYSLNNKYLNRE